MDIKLGRTQRLFIASETSHGVGGAITSDSSILPTGDPTFTQAVTIHPDDQRRGTRSMFKGILGSYGPGDYSFPCYIKPSGTLGVAPRIGPLLKACFGKETIDTGVDVRYTLSEVNDLTQTLLIVFSVAGLTFWNYGCTVSTASFTVSGGGGPESIGAGTFSGSFLRQKIAGTSAINNVGGYVATDTEIIVDNAKNFMDETRIKIKKSDGSWEDNTDAGYLISNVNYATNTLTIEALAGGIDDDAVVTGWTPSVITESGFTVNGKLGLATRDLGSGPENIYITGTTTIELNNNFTMPNEQKSDGLYPIGILPGDRTVTVSLEHYVDGGYVRNFHAASNQTLSEISMPVGNVAGKRYAFSIPKFESDTPTVGGGITESKITMAGRPVSEVGDDEIELIFN